MAHRRRFRFGVQVSNAASGEEWAAIARKAEDLGYSSLFMAVIAGGGLAIILLLGDNKPAATK